MGMITRVRARLQSIHTLANKMDPKVQDERTAQTVCLLSVLLLLPYFLTKLQPNVLLSSASLAYSCLVIPMIVSANYKYPVSVLRSSLNIFRGTLLMWSALGKQLMIRTYAHVDRCERVYIKMVNISSMISQLIVFMLCDRVLLSNQRLTSLYSLMFYNVLAYCVSYIREIATKEDWSLSIHLASHSSIRHLAMSTTKVVLEWTRAVTFIITLVFMLLVFGVKQGLQHYDPTWIYLCLTALYYMMTERIFVLHFPSLLALFRLEILESLEHVWAHVILKVTTAFIAGLLSFIGLIHGQWKLSLFGFYTCVWLRLKDVTCNEMAALREHQFLLSRYRFATKKELEDHDDVCAVCLWPMKFARITPCQHVFHGDCLRRCLQNSNQCPLCKREFKFE